MDPHPGGLSRGRAVTVAVLEEGPSLADGGVLLEALVPTSAEAAS